MKSHKLLFMLLGAAVLASAPPIFSMEADEGAKIVAEVCSGCHSAEVRPLDNIRMTREQWKETIDRMIENGAEISKGKIPVLLDYLVRTHGPISSAPDTGKK